MKPKVCMTKAKQIEHWTQQYLQAKLDGNTKLMRIYKDLIVKLGSVPPKF